MAKRAPETPAKSRGSAAPPAGARERIMLAALEMFANHGFGSTSMKALAARAGVSPGLIYVYFESKDDLLVEVFEQGMRDVQATLEPTSSDEPTAALETLVRHSFALVAEHEDLWRLLYALRLQTGLLDRVSSAYRQWTRTIETELTDLCQRAGHDDPSTSAKALFAVIDGANQHRLVDPGSYPTEAMVVAITRLFERSSKR